MKIVLGVFLALVFAGVVVFFIRGIKQSKRILTSDEEEMRNLVHEVYGDKITAESLEFSNDNAKLTVTLRDENVTNLDINLTSLAHKYRDQGVSKAVIKLSLKF